MPPVDLSKGNLPITVVLSIIGGLLFWGIGNEVKVQKSELKTEIQEERASELGKISKKLDNIEQIVSAQLSDKEPFKKDHYEIMRKALAAINIIVPSYDDIDRQVERDNRH